MTNIQRAIYESGAHIVFKETRPEKPTPLRKWKVPAIDRPSKPRQRIVGGIPRDPVNKTAALVTSKQPKL